LPVGYDLASCPEYLVAMIEARDSGEPTVSRARKVSGGRDLGPARLVFLPTFTMEAASVDAAGRAFHSGTVFAVLDPRSLLSRILTAVNVSTLNVRVEEFREPMEWRTIYANTLTVDKPPNAGDPGGLLYAGDLNLPGVTWRLVCSPTQGLVDRYHTGLPWALLGAGIVFTVLLTAYVALLSGHAVQVEQEVRKRTTQLQQANRELRAGFNERRRLEQEILDVGTLEKRRIGQDLHDSLAQQLTGIGLMSKVLARELAEADPVHADQAEKVSSAMKDARAMVRRIARGLTPVELDAEGLCDALQQLVEDTMSLYDLKCELMMDAACMIYSDQQAMHLYHIAQEAVNNAARHAGAGHVVIRLSGGPRDGMMSVEDDGSGIDERLAGKTGLGLRTMRYRAEIIGGRLDIQPRETGGTRVVCRFVTDQDKPGHPT
jgi:signal transduction histidine kinase